MASVLKASAAALRLPMAVTRAHGGQYALYIILAGSPELGATSARSKWVLALAAGRDQNSADLSTEGFMYCPYALARCS